MSPSIGLLFAIGVFETTFVVQSMASVAGAVPTGVSLAKGLSISLIRSFDYYTLRPLEGLDWLSRRSRIACPVVAAAPARDRGRAALRIAAVVAHGCCVKRH
jgi:hypothetical protein